MNKRFRMLIALVLVVVAAYIADVPLSLPSTKPDARPTEFTGSYRVVRVSDGDTIVIDASGSDVSVRLIGIDSPEVDSSYTRAECFGKEASDEAKRIMNGTSVRIETDPSQDQYDAYDRLLAYVYVPANTDPNGILVNRYMVENGFAREYTFKKAYREQASFAKAEREAKQLKKGLWAVGACPLL